MTSRSRAWRARLSALAALAAAAPAAAETAWEHRASADPATKAMRHTVQTRLDYDGSSATFAYVCARGVLVLTVAASWPIAAVLRYRFPPADWQWIEGRAVAPSTIVFDGKPALDLFHSLLAERAIVLRLPGPKSMTEKPLSLEGFAEKAKALKESCL